MAKGKVFISYRRDDAAGFSHVIRDRLIEHLPKERVFMDVSDIEAGADFVKTLQDAVSQCDVLIALMGKRWAGAERDGRSRLNNRDDWIRVEVSTALNRGVKVIPVLLDGATMPQEGSLPPEMRTLVRINAVDVRNSRLNADVYDLTGVAMKALGETWPPDEPGGPIYAALSGIYAFLAGAIVLFVMLASMFMEQVALATMIGVLLFILNALVILRLPIHPRVRTLTRQQALKIGAILHLVAFSVMSAGATGIDGVMIFVFGIIPTALLFLAAFAMQRRARS
jgi:TIR domain